MAAAGPSDDFLKEHLLAILRFVVDRNRGQREPEFSFPTAGEQPVSLHDRTQELETLNRPPQAEPQAGPPDPGPEDGSDHKRQRKAGKQEGGRNAKKPRVADPLPFPSIIRGDVRNYQTEFVRLRFLLPCKFNAILRNGDPGLADLPGKLIAHVNWYNSSRRILADLELRQFANEILKKLWWDFVKMDRQRRRGMPRGRDQFHAADFVHRFDATAEEKWELVSKGYPVLVGNLDEPNAVPHAEQFVAEEAQKKRDTYMGVVFQRGWPYMAMVDETFSGAYEREEVLTEWLPALAGFPPCNKEAVDPFKPYCEVELFLSHRAFGVLRETPVIQRLVRTMTIYNETTPPVSNYFLYCNLLYVNAWYVEQRKERLFDPEAQRILGAQLYLLLVTAERRLWELNYSEPNEDVVMSFERLAQIIRAFGNHSLSAIFANGTRERQLVYRRDWASPLIS